MRLNLLLVSITLFFAGFAVAEEIVIELNREATVTKDVVYLGDLARLECRSKGLCSRLMRFSLGTVESIQGEGDLRVITKTDIHRVLAKAVPRLVSDIAWRGASEVRLNIGHPNRSFAELTALAESYLRNHIETNSTYERLEISALGMREGMVTVRGDIRAEPRLETTGRSLRSRMCVFVDLKSGSRIMGQVPVWFLVKAYRPVLLAKDAIEAGASLDGRLFEQRLEDVAALNGTPIFPEMLADGKFSGRLLKELKPGEVLVQDNVGDPPTVRRRQLINVVLSAVDIELTTVGLALSDAWLGQSVKVMNVRSGEIYVARITGDAKAVVDLR